MITYSVEDTIDSPEYRYAFELLMEGYGLGCTYRREDPDIVVPFIPEIELTARTVLKDREYEGFDKWGIPNLTEAPPTISRISNSLWKVLLCQTNAHHLPIEKITPISPRWPDNNEFAICMTHDVDRPFGAKKFPFTNIHQILLQDQFTIGYRAKLIAGVAKSKLLPPPRNFCFDEWMEYEKSIGTKSCFYVAGMSAWESGILENPNYDCCCDEFDILKEVHKKGWEIGLHASIGAIDNGYLLTEKKRLEYIVGSEIRGVRQHYWSSGSPGYFSACLNAGFKYDSSLGLNTTIGARRGIVWPYTPMGSTLLEIPPTAMDGSLTLKHPKRRWRRSCDLIEHIRQVANVGGCAVIDWHLEQWNPNNLDGVIHTLKDVIDEIRSEYKGKIWWCKPDDLYDWWILRRMVLNEQ